MNRAYSDIKFDYEYTREELIIALKPKLIIKTCCDNYLRVTDTCNFYDYTHNSETLHGLGWKTGYYIVGCKNCFNVNTGKTGKPRIFDINDKDEGHISCSICGKQIGNYILCSSCEGLGRMQSGSTIWNCSSCNKSGLIKKEND